MKAIRLSLLRALLLCALFLGAAVVNHSAAAELELKPGDHVSIIGNTLAERMQHHGWFETLLQARFPQYQLVVRNLGFPGDELTERIRSAGFGTPDEHLAANQSTVVLAFFGYNESYAGAEGLPKFKQDLTDFIRHTREQKYNGADAPRIVICSPIAHENLQSPDLPSGEENNLRLALYTTTIAEVARAENVGFVDLFAPSLRLYEKADQPLTINGVHLTEDGDRRLAPVLMAGLFGAAEAPPSVELAKLRAAVLDKNFYWFNRYRTVDGYSIYGGRADLKFHEGQTNRVVMQREMEVLDAITANRDRRIWAVAAGGDLKLDDSNTPPFLEVITNKPGAGPNGAHLYDSAEKAIEHMTVAKNMRVNVFATEEQFPELAKAVQMAFDTRGRLWIATMPSYPHWKPKEEMNDKVVILEDTDGDGRADTCKVFADKLHVPTGLEFYRGGLIVGNQPDLLFLKDTDGDDVADVRERILTGLDSADTHHAMNSFTLDPGGALYFQEGTFHHTQVETPWGPTVRSANAAVYRYEPRAQKFDVYVPYNFANPHGHVFDAWGQDFVTDGTGNVNYFAAAFSGHLDYPNKHERMNAFFPQRSRPCPGTEILSSRHFPEEMQGDYLVGNVIGFQGIFHYKFQDAGSGFTAEEVEPIVSSSDPNFRPVDFELGPDGALYFLDWQNPIIGHMQHNLRDPSRDRLHGRVYRVTYEGRPLLAPPQIAGAPIAALLELLQEPENRTRYRAKIELGDRKTVDVIAALKQWLAALDRNDPNYEHHVLEGLWLHQYHNVVDVALLERVLASPDYRARAAATRVLCYWRDRVPDVLGRLRGLAADTHPRVRLEAVRAASFLPAGEAIDVPFISAGYPTDYYLDYTRHETLRALEPHWRAALAAGKKLKLTSEAAQRYLLRNMTLEQLLAADRTRTMYLELLFRPGLNDQQRGDALAELAALQKETRARVLVDALAAVDQAESDREESVVFDLVRLLAGRSGEELAAVRSQLENLATNAQRPVVRQVGYVALMTIDGSPDRAWLLGTSSVNALRDLLAAVPLIGDMSLRAANYPRIAPLLEALPEDLRAGKAKPTGPKGRFVRIELPERGTLTLAEVEVYSGGRNIARQGKVKQSSTANGGDAQRAIDGNKSGSFGDKGQTHTAENDRKPWWELDLGSEQPIESIVVYNRTEGALGKRLDKYSLRILDGQRGEAYRKDNNPAPAPKAEVALGVADPAILVRAAAMLAMASVRGQELNTFNAVAPFVRRNEDRAAAIRALQRVPRKFWPTPEAAPLLEMVTSHVRETPVPQRTSPEALEALEFADALASLLPADQAKKARAELGELGVRVIRIGTLLERMSYDQDLIVVRAGKPVEFVFDNSDLMPHNLVIAQPGYLEEIGLAAEATGNQPDAAVRQFVPKSDKILLSSRLLQPRDSQQLSFTAPTAPGVYPYVCTYPGHWRRMYGALYVVEDLEEYQANPEAYLAAHPLEIRDELLKDRRPRTEWKYTDLAIDVEAMRDGRSYGNGKQMFTAATCIACHRLENVGNQFGPDLAQLEPKWMPAEIAKEMLEPSAKINEKFQTYLFETDAGQVLTGLILEEKDGIVRIIENPLAKAQPTEIKRSEIVAQEKSPVSMMPKGLLDKLSREEILDLVAYVRAAGNRQHPLFQKSGEGHGGGH